MPNPDFNDQAFPMPPQGTPGMTVGQLTAAMICGQYRSGKDLTERDFISELSVEQAKNLLARLELENP